MHCLSAINNWNAYITSCISEYLSTQCFINIIIISMIIIIIIIITIGILTLLSLRFSYITVHDQASYWHVDITASIYQLLTERCTSVHISWLFMCVRLAAGVKAVG